MLEKIVSTTHRDWDVHVPSVMAAYRASVHSATEYTPNYLMLGREVRGPVDLLLWVLAEEDGLWVSIHEYVANVQDRLRRCYDVTRQHLGAAASRWKEVYDRKIVKQRFRVGQLVWYYYPRPYSGRSPKWSKTYTGPMLIITVISGTNVRIQRSQRSKPLVVHMDKLKVCRGDTPPSWLGPRVKDSNDDVTTDGEEDTLGANAEDKEPGVDPQGGRRGDEARRAVSDNSAPTMEPAETTEPDGPGTDDREQQHH